MAPSKAKTKRIIVKKLPKFELDVYSTLTLSDLVVFALSYLEEREIPAATEEMISLCFRLFPHSFGLKTYPRWPDSALVIRRLNDAREKKLIKGTPADGFALTFKGKQVARRVGKLLGILKPVAKKKNLPKQARKPILKTSTSKKPVKKSIQVTFTKKKVANKPVKKKTVQKIVKKPILKVNQKSVTKTAIKKKSTVKKSQPKQLTTTLATPAKIKKIVSVKSKQVQVKKEAAKPVKMEMVITPVSISKEEKEKAGKVIKIVERSDAYRSYTKNGKQAKISEFDFRNMLLATMESSSDTLTRNVGLFKRYADIYNRNDLTKFFDFCEERFASLLKKKR